MARLYHPVIGEAALRHAGVARIRQLNSMLAQQLQRQNKAEEQRARVPDVRSRIQLAQFMMRSDMAPDLDPIIDAAASAMTMSNFACGEELAIFAFDCGGGLPAAIVHARALSWRGRGDETEAVLADVAPPDGADEWLIVPNRVRLRHNQTQTILFTAGRLNGRLTANVTFARDLYDPEEVFRVADAAFGGI